MNYWVLTDTHFGHELMHKYCNRPVGFEDVILKNLKRVVNKADVLIHLGDFCVYKNEYWHERFMDICICKRWLIRGNHDRKSNSWYLRNGWDCVADKLNLRAFGKDILFSHIPTSNLNGSDINIHGHIHNTQHHPECTTDARHKAVIMEHEYKPVNLRSIVEETNRQ